MTGYSPLRSRVGCAQGEGEGGDEREEGTIPPEGAKIFRTRRAMMTGDCPDFVDAS